MSDETKARPYNFKDLTGQRFGRLAVIEMFGRDKRGTIMWKCACDCGEIRNVRSANLLSGQESCGCAQREIGRPKTHGHSCGKRTSEYRAWLHMRSRCYLVTDGRYYAYGARGIRVCDRWLNDFLAFLADVGPKPSPKHSIDRIDSNGHYEPGNVRWATSLEQNRNRTDNKLTAERAERMRSMAADGVARKEIAKAFGVCVSTVRDVINGRRWGNAA